MSHDSSSKRKKRRKKEDASWTFANRSTRESEHQSGVYLNRTLNITFKRGEKIEWVRDSEWVFHACWSREAFYVALLQVRSTWAQSGEELSWGMLWDTGGVVSFKVSVFFFHLSLSLSLFRPFSAPIPVSWLYLDVVGSWITLVCGFVYVYVILGISHDGTFNPSWMVG